MPDVLQQARQVLAALASLEASERAATLHQILLSLQELPPRRERDSVMARVYLELALLSGASEREATLAVSYARTSRNPQVMSLVKEKLFES